MEARVGTGKVGELADMMERHYVDTVYCLCRRPGERKQVMSLGGGFKNWGEHVLMFVRMKEDAYTWNMS